MQNRWQSLKTELLFCQHVLCSSTVLESSDLCMKGYRFAHSFFLSLKYLKSLCGICLIEKGEKKPYVEALHKDTDNLFAFFLTDWLKTLCVCVIQSPLIEHLLLSGPYYVFICLCRFEYHALCTM